MSAIVSVNGLEPIEVEGRFTTTVRYIEKAEREGTLVTLRTTEGRVAVKPSQVTRICEVKGSEPDTPEPAEDHYGATDTETTGPFNKAS